MSKITFHCDGCGRSDLTFTIFAEWNESKQQMTVEDMAHDLAYCTTCAEDMSYTKRIKDENV